MSTERKGTLSRIRKANAKADGPPSAEQFSWNLDGPTRKGTNARVGVSPKTIPSIYVESAEDTFEVFYDFDPTGNPVGFGPRPAAATGPLPTARATPTAKAKTVTGPVWQPDGMDPAQLPAENGFHNPYTHIPAPKPTEEAKADASLGWRAPAGHAAWGRDLWSGRISVDITAHSPLLLLDAANARPHPECADHDIFDMLSDASGRPLLKPTALKGALRSAYEAVTNSRMAVFDRRSPLARRMDAKEGLAMIPARISDDGQYLELFLGFAQANKGVPDDSNWLLAAPAFDAHSKRFNPPGGTMYAAWLPRYAFSNSKPNNNPHRAIKLEGGGLPKHRDRVACLVVKVHYSRPPIQFDYWIVEKIAPAEVAESVAALKALDGTPTALTLNGRHTSSGNRRLVEGFVCIGNETMKSKHDERVFFTIPGEAPVRLPLARYAKLIERWSHLIDSYEEKNKSAMQRRGNASLSRYQDENNTAFSRHIIQADKARNLGPGDLVYARIDRNRSRITGLYPVMIARELYDDELAPVKLLGEDLAPAESLDSLSPADRVFGWVRQRRDGAEAKQREAWKGQLRVAEIACAGGPGIRAFDKPLPLAILAAPKPEQALFYAANADGQPARQPAYTSGMILRGRKTYPHRATLPRGYWDMPSTGWSNASAEVLGKPGWHREYARANGVTDNQNRSVTGWVDPGTRFRAEIDVVNLTCAELGALLFLLSLDKGFFKLGGGKPLGFGSVAFAIAGLDVKTGAQLAKEYATLALLPATAAPD